MKITVYGSGYVGLVTGACLADVGNDVLCVDIDAQKTAMLQQGHIPIYEPGLEQIVKANTAEGRLTFTTSPEEGVAHGVLQFIAVGTPPDEDGSADLQHVLAVAASIGQYMTEYRVIIDKSTVPVGTAERVQNTINEALKKRDIQVEFDIASNPEFLKEGAAIDDFMRPDRVVLGTESKRAEELLHALYVPFMRNHDRILNMDIRSAELTKYAANAMLATKISFMNELANIAEHLGADIENVRIGIGSDPRIGYHFIYPGCGYGGSCFPKDVQALERTAAEVGYDSVLLRAVEAVNANQKELLFRKISHHFNNDLKGKTFAVWGLSFKPNTDDMRAAPSSTLIKALIANGASIKAFDPEAEEEARRIFGDNAAIEYFEHHNDALNDADALVIVTEWRVFRSPDFSEIKERLKQAVIFDGRNIYDPALVEKEGFSYYGIGRGLSDITPI